MRYICPISKTAGKLLIIGTSTILLLFFIPFVYAQETPKDENLVEMLRSGSEGDQIRAADDLRWKKKPSNKEIIIALSEILYQDRSTEVKWRAADALGQIGQEPDISVPALTKALENKETGVKRHAIESLIKFGPQASPAIDRLMEILGLDIEDSDVRGAAARALGSIGPQASIAFSSLNKALTSTDDNVQLNAAKGLGGIGVAARPSIPTLLLLLKESTSYSRKEIAQSLVNIANVLAEEGKTDGIDEVIKIQETLRSLSDPRMEEFIETLNRVIKSLEIQLPWPAKTYKWMEHHPVFASLIGWILVCSSISFLLFWVRPVWVLKINNSLKSYTSRIPILGGLEIQIRYLLVIGFFHYRHRVLDAWVKAHIDSARNRFEKIPAVAEHKTYFTLPLSLNGEHVFVLTPELLKKHFVGNHRSLLISGSGGTGKTSLAFQIAKWAMLKAKNDRISEHFMIPVLINHEFEAQALDDQNSFINYIRGQLRLLLDEDEEITQELLKKLIEKRRILVILDEFSEMDEKIQQRIKQGNLPANCLIITSRSKDLLNHLPIPTIETISLKSDQIIWFVDRYLQDSLKRPLFGSLEYLDLCRQLCLVSANTMIPVLIVKSYIDFEISVKEDPTNDYENNIRRLVFDYLNALNRYAKGTTYQNHVVHSTAKLIAWICLRDRYHPIAAARKEIVNELMKPGFQKLIILDNDFDYSARQLMINNLLDYFEKHLGILQTTGPESDFIEFRFSSIARYLASLHVVDQYGREEVAWRDLLSKIYKAEKDREDVIWFLIALRDACLSVRNENSIPQFVIEELDQVMCSIFLNNFRNKQVKSRVVN